MDALRPKAVRQRVRQAINHVIHYVGVVNSERGSEEIIETRSKFVSQCFPQLAYLLSNKNYCGFGYNFVPCQCRCGFDKLARSSHLTLVTI